MGMLSLFTACGGSIKQNSPSDAVLSINAAVREGDVETVLAMIDPVVMEQPQMKSKIQGMIGIGVAAAQSENGGVAQVEIVKEIIRGDSATVKVIDHYNDGTEEENEVNLVKRDGKWYMAFEDF
jgi:hypothetical protein